VEEFLRVAIDNRILLLESAYRAVHSQKETAAKRLAATAALVVWALGPFRQPPHSKRANSQKPS
jgi:hypothetical protein